MAWYSMFGKFWSGKTSTAKTNNQPETTAAEDGAKAARKSVASTINKGAISVKDDTLVMTQDVEPFVPEPSNIVEPQAASAQDNPVTPVGPVDTKVEKLRHHKRPGMSSHDSVGDKFKHAFKLDHKQHHPQKETVPTAP